MPKHPRIWPIPAPGMAVMGGSVKHLAGSNVASAPGAASIAATTTGNRPAHWAEGGLVGQFESQI